MPVKLNGACFLVALTLVSSTAFAQKQHGGSADDQAACTPDVYNLCSQYIPDEDDIVACLQRKKAQLSPACHAVFSRPDAAPTKPTPPDDDD